MIYILCMIQRHKEQGRVNGCSLYVQITPHPYWVTGTETVPPARFAIRGMPCDKLLCNCFTCLYISRSYTMLPSLRSFLSSLFFSFMSLYFFCPFSLTLSSLFLFSPLSVCRIWWMTSAKSSSWRWAIWTEARTTEGESEVACRSGAAESLLQEHTGVEIHAPTLCYITTAGSVNVVQKHKDLLQQSINVLTKV